MNVQGTTLNKDLTEVYSSIDSLLYYAVHNLELDTRDINWTRNRILELLALDSYSPSHTSSQDPDPCRLLAKFHKATIDAGLLPDGRETAYDDRVMGMLSLKPSDIQDRFNAIERTESGMKAMHWFYDYCVANSYVKKTVLDLNPRFYSHGLMVTINLAKPEFKTMKKATSDNVISRGYPKCTICRTNEGFAERNKRTLRTVPIALGEELWFWQFSPYGYFNQHGICVNSHHIPMHIDCSTFGHLLDFVDRFPGYFLGCNAALPRIGGSVLAHDHYQGGGEALPMHKAKAWKTLYSSKYSDAIVEILDWPGTAVRVVSQSRRSTIEISDSIRLAWTDYDNPSLGIKHHGKNGQQSALSPSAIRTKRGYEMNLIFRNNGISEDFPEGVFHAHPEFWAIKQEPIGLIEAQGLFILPGRLIQQLDDIENALTSGNELPKTMAEFAFVWQELIVKVNGSPDRKVIHAAIRDELGSICERILENTAVFKDKNFTLEFLEESVSLNV